MPNTIQHNQITFTQQKLLLFLQEGTQRLVGFVIIVIMAQLVKNERQNPETNKICVLFFFFFLYLFLHTEEAYMQMIGENRGLVLFKTFPTSAVLPTPAMPTTPTHLNSVMDSQSLKTVP